MEPLGNDRWRGLVRRRRRSAATSTRSRPGSTTGSDVAARPRQAARRRPGRDGRPPDRRGPRRRRGRRAAADGATEDAEELERWAARLREGTAARGALDEDLDARMRRHPDRDHVTTLRADARRSSSTRCAPASRPGTSCSRARRRPTPGRHGTLRDVIDRLPYVAGPGLRRPLPAADPPDRDDRSARARTTRRRRAPTTPACPWAIGGAGGRPHGHPPRARHARRTSTRWSTRPRRAASRSRSTSRSRPRPTTRGSREHPEWFRAAPRRHDPVRREPAEEVPGHLPVRLRVARTGAALWHALRDVFAFWIGQGVTIFRVDNPHTKAFAVLGVGASATLKARPPGGALPGRGVHAAEGDVPAGQARLQPVVHVLHVAQHEAGADASTSRSSRDRRSREFFRPNFWPNTPDILHETLQTRRPADVRGAPRPGGDAVGELRHLRPGVRAGASTRRASRAARSTSTRRSTSSGTWDLDAPDIAARR